MRGWLCLIHVKDTASVQSMKNQPMVALWAELDLVVADEFRDGNVPAKQDPLTCAQAAFAALPATVRQRYFRGDSACHNNQLLGWLRHPDRAKEPGGPIHFAVSAMLSDPLAEALRAVGSSSGRPLARKTTGRCDNGPRWISCRPMRASTRRASP